MSKPNILIVGGGVIGLSIAEHLVQKGLQPTVLDRGSFAREASWAGAGFLDLRSASRVDGTFFEFCKRSFDLYPDWCERLRKDSGVDPEYRRSGSLDVAFTPEEEDGIRQMERKMAAYGEKGSWLSRTEALEREPGLSGEVRSALYIEKTSQVRPPRLNQALIGTLKKNGVRLREEEPVEEFIVRDGKVRGVRTSHGPVEADLVVLSCGPWSGQLAEKLGIPLPNKPFRGQAVLYRTAPDTARHILFTGLGKAFTYLVPRKDGRCFVGSTLEDAGYDKSTTPEGMAKLQNGAAKLIPGLSPERIETTWAGLRPGSVDGWPYLGTAPGYEGLWIATGHYTHGLLQAPVTGRLMAQALLGEKTDMDLAPFAPGRKPHAVAGL